MKMTRRETLKLAGAAAVGAVTGSASGQDLTTDKIPPRMPLDEFVKDPDLMAALVRGVRAMKARKASDPLSWFFQASIHGATVELIQIEAAKDPNVITVDQKKYWNQCPHSGQASANFLPWHRAYTHYFERILRAHTGEPRFALPYWDCSKPENRRFPQEFGTKKLKTPVDNNADNPLWHKDRNLYFTSWEHWSDPNFKPYVELSDEAVDWSPARDSKVFFGKSEQEGLGGGVADEDSGTRGRLESFPHDPLHRVTGVIVLPQIVPDPNDPSKTITKPDFALGMSSPPTAGFDPIFCVHHSNIDRLWLEWSLMPGKEWGNFPPQDWFDEEEKWWWFDVTLKNGQLNAVEVTKARKAYFDHRALGISFKYEDLSKTPLTLPDPIPPPPPPPSPSVPLLLAKISTPMKVSGLLAERVDTATEAEKLTAPFAEAKAVPANAPEKKRMLMRINGINLGGISATGFDVYLTTSTNAQLKRSDSSFLGSISLFRHDDHSHHTGGHGSHVAGSRSSTRPSDTFDITQALQASAETDPKKLHVVIKPHSLLTAVGQAKLMMETTSLSFESIEFFSK